MSLPKTFRISCQSDVYDPNKDYVGFIVWDVGTYTEKKILPGYVVIYDSAKACNEHPNAGGQVHGAGVKKFFRYACSTMENKYNMVLGGFAVRAGTGVKTKSCTLNKDGAFGKDCQMFEPNAIIIHEITRQWKIHGPATTYIRPTQSRIIEVKNSIHFSNILSRPRVVVDFYAEWCPACTTIAPDYEKLARQYPDITFVKVNVDKNKCLASRWGITSMPCFKMLTNGKERDNLSGCNAKELKRKVNNLNIDSYDSDSYDSSDSDY